MSNADSDKKTPKRDGDLPMPPPVQKRRMKPTPRQLLAVELREVNLDSRSIGIEFGVCGSAIRERWRRYRQLNRRESGKGNSE